MVDVLASDINAGDFFATVDPPPGNVWCMRVPPTPGNPGLCQNVCDDTWWFIWGNRFVRRIAKHEYDRVRFDV